MERRKTFCEAHAAERRAARGPGKSARYRERQKEFAQAGQRAHSLASGELVLPGPVAEKLERAAKRLEDALAFFDSDMGEDASYLEWDPDAVRRREAAPRALRLFAKGLLREVEAVLAVTKDR